MIKKNKNFIITISGTPGSGKSTVAKNISSIFKAQRIYTGGLWRDIAKEKNMTLEEFHEYVTNNPQIDIDLDKKVASQARKLVKETNVIVEGRVQFLFLPESIKIFIKADLTETAKRVWKEIYSSKYEQRKAETHIKSLAEMEIKQKERRVNDIKRYKKIYNIDYTDASQYDFVLDTTNLSIKESAQKTADFIKNQLKT